MLEAAAAYRRGGPRLRARTPSPSPATGSELDERRREGRLARALPDVGLGRRPHLGALRRRPPARGAPGPRRRRPCSPAPPRATRRRASRTSRRTRRRCSRSRGTTPTGGRGAKDMVVLPYKDRLLLFSRYLQQLVMESLGKEKDLDGTRRPPGHRRLRQQGLDRPARLRAAAPRGRAELLRHLHRGRDATARTAPRRSRSSPTSPRATTCTASSSARGRRSTRTAAARSRSPCRTSRRAAGRHPHRALRAGGRPLRAARRRSTPTTSRASRPARRPRPRSSRCRAGSSRTCARRRASSGPPRSIAAALGEADIETVFAVLRHLAANPDHGVSRKDGPTYFLATFGTVR